MPYAALHNHSWFSLLDSPVPPDQLVAAAEACGMTAVGLTDRDTLAGAVAFWKKCRDLNLHAVTGSEVTMEDGSTLVLLVENARGYSNLCRLLTTRIDHPNGVTWDDLGRFGQGLICLAGSRSSLARAIRRNQPPEPELRRLRDLFDRNLALEISPHNDDDLRLARLMAELARRHKVALAAGADAHYLDPSDRLRFDILQSMRTLTMLNQPHPDKLPAGRHHFHSPEELARYFGSLPQAIENTQRIAERCQFDFELGDIHFPKFPCADAVAELRARTRKGVERRYGLEPRAEVAERLEREMSIIEEVGYAEYFLVFSEIVDWCASKDISTLARGSAAGSLVCYLVGISNVCPFRFGLCFERFLNRERMQFAKLADIDLDLPWDRRDEVIQHVFDQYGRDHVAMIGAVHTFKGRSAVADIAKVYGIPEREARRFTENLPWHVGDAREAVVATPECRDLPFNDEPYKTVLAMAGSFDGIPRHFAMHPCGLVVSGSPVVDKMPLFESSKGILTTHYTMDDVEELGLLKMDLLGQAGLTVLHDTLENLADSGKPRPDLDKLDWTDTQTWDVIAKGEARGVFHIESPAMTSLLVMSDCRDIDCLTTVESIIRPGAANEGKKRAFARRYQGLEPPEYVHPSLEPLLRDTYGLMAFEEHILLVANGFAAMPWGRADLLRRALVKNRDHACIDSLGDEFRQSARGLGRTEAEIDAVWAQLRDFAGYMFNKAHSAAYAVEAFAGAWLKTRYPVEFLAAVLTSRRGFYSPMVYVLEALRQGARFLLPDLHESDPKRFLTGGETIRLPLDQVKGLTAKTLERIVDARPFADVGDFYRKARPAHDEWLALLKSGTLDCLGEPRGRLFWRLQRLEASTKSVVRKDPRPAPPAVWRRPISPAASTLVSKPAPWRDGGVARGPGGPPSAEQPCTIAQTSREHRARVPDEPRPEGAGSGVVFRQSPDGSLGAAKVDEKQDALCDRRANAPVRARPPGRADEPVFQPSGPRAVFDDPPEPWVTGELPETFEADARTRAKWEVETLGFPVSLHPLECFGPRVAWKNYITVARLTERQREFYGKTVRVCGLIVADRRHPTAQGTMKFLTLADWTGFVEVSLFARTYREYGHLTVRPVVSVEATVDAHDNRKGFSLSGIRVGAVE